MCPANELYYPGDQKDDWICDCRPAYLYHPASDSCWPAWTRGPCAEKQYLVLPSNTVIPVCEQNPCDDGKVPWNTKCETLGSSQPCVHLFPPTVAVLGVNATTLAIECVALTFSSRLTESNNISGCSPGCRRNVKGECTFPIV
ncbi:hypothetical protein EVAR_28376_1 [Eumeta japonica]|uniref:DUF4789 domain-containing protein n=1 Tax=Eumeta variegata TaxID=151549 RepID=A0A4C1XCL2_EUMVA|nr:hypothetical protein EVAR_28376_1 [Eumeta japonica]